MCPYTVSTWQGKPCFLFRAYRYSSGLIRRGLCGLWRCCLHLSLWRYCRFFRLKALRDMHGGGHDLEVLKELRTAPDLAPRVTKVMARSLGRAISTLVVQERHLWPCLVDIGTPAKFGSSKVPVSQTGLFGDATGNMAQQLPADAVELGVGRPPLPSWPPSTGGKRRSKRLRDGRPRERGNCFGRG